MKELLIKIKDKTLELLGKGKDFLLKNTTIRVLDILAIGIVLTLLFGSLMFGIILIVVGIHTKQLVDKVNNK